MDVIEQPVLTHQIKWKEKYDSDFTIHKNEYIRPHLEKRIIEIGNAIVECTEKKIQINGKWLIEYNEHLATIKSLLPF